MPSPEPRQHPDAPEPTTLPTQAMKDHDPSPSGQPRAETHPSFRDFEAIRVTVLEDRLIAQLNRPAVRNAIDQSMVSELHTICAYLETTPQILILTGTPADPITGAKAIFASGADISQLRDRRRDDALRGINSTIFSRIAALPMPVIAALDGFALGGGAELAYAADFRIGTALLRVGQPEVGLGIMAAAGAVWRLKELVGEPLAKELLLSGRILSGTECLAAGIITELVESDSLLEAAGALADRIAKQDPLAVRLTKLAFHAPRESHPVIDALVQGILFESEAKFERMDGFLARKKTTEKERS
jgi:enoyl-CoA hydratase